MVMMPLTSGFFRSCALIASATAVGLPKEVGGSGSCSAVPPARGHAIDDALAARLEVRGARNGIDAEDLGRAVLGDVLAAGLAGEVFVAADVVERAELLGLLVAAGVEDDHRNAGVDRGLDRLVLRFGNPVRHRDRRRPLAHGGANEVRGIRPEVVVGLRLQVGCGSAVSLHDERSVVEALLDDRPERIVGLAADDKDLGAILRHRPAGRHQRRGRLRSAAAMRFIWVMIFPPPVSLSGEIPFRGLIYTIRSEIIIGTIRDRRNFVSCIK